MAKDDVAKLRAAAAGDCRGSPLYRWMWRHHDAFRPIADASRPNWKGIAACFTELGYRLSGGGELTPNAVMKTWERVSRRHGAQAAAVRATARPQQPEFKGEVAEDASGPVVRPALPLRGPASPAQADVAGDHRRAGVDRGANERDIARIRDRIRALEGSMPDPFT
jgi:hypothetical protein